MLEIKAMNFIQFDEYQDYVEELEEKGVKQNKIGRLAARWIAEKVYGLNLKEVDLTPGQIMGVVGKTIEATLKNEDENAKN